MKDFAGSTYIERAKYYEEEYATHHQKQYQKQYQKQEQHSPYPKKPQQWSTEQHGENDNPLSKSELEYFFWNKLVPLGWRQSFDNVVKDLAQLILVCPKCNTGVVSQQGHSVTYRKAKRMSDETYIANELKLHESKCKPLEYDEDGNLIEAIPEARPQMFEKPVAGTIRLDVIDNQMMVFDGERWIKAQ